MSDFVRVKDKATGHEYSTSHVTDNHEVLDKRAVDANGRPLPAKPKTTVAKKASASKAAPSSEPTNGAESATTPEEGSAS